MNPVCHLANFLAVWRRLIPALLFCLLPANAQWTQLPPCPESRTVSILLIDSILVVATLESGLYYSSALGNSWSHVGADVPGKTVIKSLTKTGSTVFAAAESLLFRSEDVAKTWLQTGIPAGGGDLLWVHGHGDLVFAKMDSGMYVSSDLGGTWFPGSFSGVGQSIYRLFSHTNGFLFAQSNIGFFRSEDSGSTWVPSGSGLPNGAKGFPREVNVLLERGDTLLAGVSGGGVFSSGDQGQTWVEFCNQGLWLGSWISGLIEVNGRLIAENASNGFYEFQPDSLAWRRIRGTLFGNWTPLQSWKGVIIKRTECGVMRSDDYARTWQLMSEGMRGSPVRSICNLQGEIYGFSPLSNIYRLDPAGEWKPVPGPLVRMSQLAASGSTLLAGLSEGAVKISTDRGTSWVSPSAGPIARGTLSIVSSRSSAPDDPRALYYQGSASADVFFFYRSTDDGATWSIPGAGAPYYPIILDAASKTVFAKSYTIPPEGPIRYLGLFVSSDAGTTWQLCDTSTGVSNVLILDSLVLGFSPGQLQMSSDLGQTWTPLVHPVDSLWTYCSTPWRNTWFAIKGDAVYWVRMDRVIDTLTSEGLPPLRLYSLQYFPPYLFAWLEDGTWWRLETDLVAGGVDPSPGDSQPIAFRLDQNYPNPFNPTTTIRYVVPTRSYVTLKVFNTLGQEVMVLVDGVQEAGAKTMRVDASGLPSGVYLCRMVAGRSVTSRKMLLLR